MNKLTINDVAVLNCIEMLHVGKNNPCATIHLIDQLQRQFNMDRKESIDAINHLGLIDYLDGNDRFVALSSKLSSLISNDKEKTMDKVYSLDEKKAARFKLLEALYKESGGSESEMFNIHEIGESLGFSSQLNRVTYEYLNGEGLITFKAIGGIVALTHYGIREFESALERPDSETKYFPAVNVVNNILHIGKIENSQVQVGTTQSTQIVNNNNEYKEIIKWITEVEKALHSEKNRIAVDQIQEEIASIKALLKTDKPNGKYLGMAMNTIKDLMIGVASNAIFQELVAIMPKLIP